MTTVVQDQGLGDTAKKLQA